MLFKPKWSKMLPPDLRPDDKRIDKLEKLRRSSDIPHEALYLRVVSSPVTTRRVQKNCLETLRIHHPGTPEKELLKMVLVSRTRTAPEIEITQEEIDHVMNNINSFDDLCDYIIGLEEKEPSFPDPFGIGKLIDEVLAQEET